MKTKKKTLTVWLHRRQITNKAAKKSKGKAKAKKATNAGQSSANLPAAAKRARPATRSAANQSRKRAKTAPKAKRTAAKTRKNSSKGRTSVQRDAGWADAVEEDLDNPTLTAAEVEEEMKRQDALHVMEGPDIGESSSGESVEWPSFTLPTRNRGRRKAPAAEPQARKRAEPKSQKRAAPKARKRAGASSAGERGPPPPPGSYKGTHTSCVGCGVCSLPLTSGDCAHNCHSCRWPVHTPLMCTRIFFLPRTDGPGVGKMFCPDCAPPESRNDNGEWRGGEPPDAALDRLLQSRAGRAAGRAAARERAEIDASRAMENGVNINPGLRELVDDPGARKWFRGESSGSASAAESD